METREELLAGLRYVKSQITKIVSETNRQVELVNTYRAEEARKEKEKNVATKGAGATFTLTLGVLFIAYAMLLAVLHRLGEGMLYIVCAVVIYFTWNKESKLKIASYFMLALCALEFLYFVGSLLLSGNFAGVLILAVFAVIGFFVMKLVIKLKNVEINFKNKRIDKKNEEIDKKNREINQYNENIKAQYEVTVANIAALQEDLYRRTSSWYPKDYYSLYAVNSFISDVENRRADTMKEAVLRLDETEYRNNMLASQEKIAEINRQQIINQQVINEQLTFANIMNMQNLMLNYQQIYQ